jgi:hypothetical protein
MELSNGFARKVWLRICSKINHPIQLLLKIGAKQDSLRITCQTRSAEQSQLRRLKTLSVADVIQRQWYTAFVEWYSRGKTVVLGEHSVPMSLYLLHVADSFFRICFSANQEIPHILLNPNVHHHTHKCPSPASILSQFDLTHTTHIPVPLLHNVSTLNQSRKLSCVTVLCKHFASYQDYPNYRWDLTLSLPN